MTQAFYPDQTDYIEKLNDLAGAYEGAADIVDTVDDHIAGTADKHAASAIVNTPAGGIAATDVQAAINELDTEKQPKDATLTAFAGLTIAADKLPYGNGSDTFATTDLTSAGRALLDDADAAAQRTTLGLGTAATLASDTDTTLAANSDTRLATQKAVKAYIDALIAASDAVVFKGVMDCSANPNYPAADAGHLYFVSVAGKIGGSSGVVVEAGDMFVCKVDGTASGNQATVGANWGVVQTNITGALTAADIGSTVQAYDADLAAIAGLTSAADRLAYFTGAGSASLATFTSAARTVLDDATVADMLVTLGAAALAGAAFTGVSSVTVNSTSTALTLSNAGTGNAIDADSPIKVNYSAWPALAANGANWGSRDAFVMGMSDIGRLGVGGFAIGSLNAGVGAPIGVGGFAINDYATGSAWALYGDVQHESGASWSAGLELALKNKGSNITRTPYSKLGGVFGHWLFPGGDSAYGGNPTGPVTAGMVFVAPQVAGNGFNAGIVFDYDSLEFTSGIAKAMHLGEGHAIQWANSLTAAAARIYSSMTVAADQRIIFADAGIYLTGAAAATILRASHVTNGVNNWHLQNATTGNRPLFELLGSDPNVGGTIATKGSGSLYISTNGGAQAAAEFTHTASANRRLTFSGSNGGNPTIGTSAGDLAVSTNLAVAGSVSTSGQIVSTLVTGTAPLSVASTTAVANLNASLLGGATFAAPGTIGGGTPGAATFTTLTATGQVSLGGAAGSEALRALTTTSAANFLTAKGATTANSPVWGVAGSDTNINAWYTSKGTGIHRFATDTGDNAVVRVQRTTATATFMDMVADNGAVAVRAGGAYPIYFQTNVSATQVVLPHTASADRFLTLTGSNGGNPTIGTSAGNVAFSSTVEIPAGTAAAPGVKVGAGADGLYSMGSTAPAITAGGIHSFRFGASGTGANYPYAYSVSSGGAPVLTVFGSDTDISYILGTKGAGAFEFFTAGATTRQARVAHTAGATRYLEFTGSNGGNPSIATNAGGVQFLSPPIPPSYTVSTLPAVGTAGGMIYVSDESGGAVLAFSDGTNWRRVTDRAIVS